MQSFAKICKIQFLQNFSNEQSAKLNSHKISQNWITAKLKFNILIITFFFLSFFSSNNYINWYLVDRKDCYFSQTIFTSWCSSLFLEKTSLYLFCFYWYLSSLLWVFLALGYWCSRFVPKKNQEWWRYRMGVWRWLWKKHTWLLLMMNSINVFENVLWNIQVLFLGFVH